MTALISAKGMKEGMKERPEYSLSKTGKRLRYLRKSKGFSVEEVRRYMKLGSYQAIYKWELGQCFPAANNLLALAQLYEGNPTELLVKEDLRRDFSFHSNPIFLCVCGMDYYIGEPVQRV